MLTRAEQFALLAIAHGAVEHYVLDGITEHQGDPIRSPGLDAPGAAFVTLYVNNQLRGCIGNTRPRISLAETVHECAIAAASRDPRFPPMSPAEINGLRIEISVLTPAQPNGSPFIPVRDLAEIQLGRDGLYLELVDGRNGLLLPQVAVENQMNLQQFLEAICRKTGVALSALSVPGITLARFTVQRIDGR